MKRLFLTGGSSGLGAELIKVFTQDFHITNLSRSASAAPSNLQVNMDNTSHVSTSISTLSDPYDLCILNAGTLGSIAKAQEITYQSFQKSLSINLVSNKIIMDRLLSLGCVNFIAISSGAAKKNYDGWLEYCVGKAALRSLFIQYQKDNPNAQFRLISPGILLTKMNKSILAADNSSFPDMEKFHQIKAVHPAKSAKLLHTNYLRYLKSSEIEFDLRDDPSW